LLLTCLVDFLARLVRKMYHSRRRRRPAIHVVERVTGASNKHKRAPRARGRLQTSTASQGTQTMGAAGGATDEPDERGCVVCMSAARVIAFQCGHLCACETCAAALGACPVCRAKKTRLLRVFI